MAFYGETDNNRHCHVALAVSEGQCQSIEELWIDGKKVNFTRTDNGSAGDLLRASGSYSGRFELYEYFAANGQQGSHLRTAFPTRWSAMHQGNGVSWVYLRMFQPDYGQDTNKRFWTRFPDVSFIIKGRLITWPGQVIAEWTENAAACRHFYDTEIEEFSARNINRAAFDAAYALSNVDITSNLPAGYTEYPATEKRYTVNGPIFEAESSSYTREQLDFCWQGHTVEAGGQLYYRPGADRTVVRDLNPSDIAEVGAFSPAPALQDRVNSAILTLAQSKSHDYQQFVLPELEDRSAIARDADTLGLPSGDTNTLSISTSGAVSFAGGDPDLTGLVGDSSLLIVTDPDYFEVSVSGGSLVLATNQSAPSAAISNRQEWKLARRLNLLRNAGQMALVNSPVTAGRLLAAEIRRTRQAAAINLKLQPALDFSWHSILPTDILRVTQPSHGINQARYMVATIRHLEDWGAEVALVEHPDGIYDDTIIIPPLTPREIDLSDFRDVPEPDALTSAISSVIAPDGTMGIWATITWEAVPVSSTHIQWRTQGGQWADFTTEGLRISIPWLIDGTTYEYRGRHFNIFKLPSDWTDVAEVDATGDRTAPAAPANLDAFGVAGGYVIQWTLPTEADYQRTEILESEPAQDFSDADHERYMTGDGGFVPKASTDEVKIWVRHSDRTNNRSAVVSALATPLASTATGITITGTATASDGAVTVTFSDGTNVVIPAAAAGRGIETISKSGKP